MDSITQGNIPPFVIVAMYGKALMLAGRLTEEPTRERVIEEFTKDVEQLFTRYEERNKIITQEAQPE